MEVRFCDKRKLHEELGLSPATFKRLRSSGKWLEGVHWVRINEKCVRYNLPLCRHWLACREFPEQHGIAIREYLESLEGGAA